jgi:hypothetical protein
LYVEARAEALDERDAELSACFRQVEQNVTGLADGLADGAVGDLALSDDPRMSFSEPF